MLKNIVNNSNWHKVILFIIAFSFYGNSLSNDYVLDDVLVITGNKYVKKGISGIYDILSHDSYFGASGKVAKASGGRYRPLAVVSYALEKEFFGMKPFVFHFFNVLFYALICLLIYQFLIRHVFKDNNGAAFICAFLFAIHPAHTEVVANIKSRDEIYSLLFLLLTLHFFLKYLQSNKVIHNSIALTSFFLALLSKEHGVVFLFAIPLTVFVFTQKKIKEIIRLSYPFWIVLAGYIFLRFSVNKLSVVEETDVMNSPYLLASVQEKFATIAWVLMQYIKLFFYPYPLSYDYSYYQIPYVSFSNIQTIISIFLYAGIIIAAVVLTIKKNMAGYFLFLYLFTIFIVSNIVVNVATPMADRFLFGPGLFLIVACVLLVLQLIKNSKVIYSRILVVLCFLIAIPAFSFVRERNLDWNNNNTLYFKDVKTAKNSVRALAFCGMNIVNENDTLADTLAREGKLLEAITYFENAYKIYPGFETMFQNWGGAYYRLNKIDSAVWAWKIYKQFRPDSRFNEINDDAIAKYYYNVFHQQYILAWKKNNKEEMLTTYRQAVKAYDKMPDAWLLLGQLYLLNEKKDSAIYAWNRCLTLDPKNEKALLFLSEVK